MRAVSINYKRLSKTIARALRHAPGDYGLELDSEGWTPVEDLLTTLRKRRREWRALSEADLAQMIEQSDKQRYELRDGHIRAYYGHSMPERIEKPRAEPPETLYHGTSPESAANIRRDGLKSMRRQYVHLSADQETALQVGRRHSAEPVILEIQALEAHWAGIAFYHGNDDVWLADTIPPQFVTIP
ncbi:MAG: RNA 2'-phosphotransferase [Anaerolineae bacterium]|nr:RNA 2'-phosphotransferase [Anaerolineae bacterium]